MARSLAEEVRRVNLNLLWCNVLLLAAALGVGGIPFFLGVPKDGASFFWYILAAPFAVLSLVNLEKWLRYSQELEAYPLVVKLKERGFGAVEGVDQDLYSAQDFLGFSLGRTWLLRRGFFKLELEPLSDAVWAYSREQHSEYGFYSQPVVHFRSGKKLTGDRASKPAKVELFLTQLSQAVPWIILGQNDQVAKLWTKERENFLSQVDQRRKALESQKRRPIISEPEA